MRIGRRHLHPITCQTLAGTNAVLSANGGSNGRDDYGGAGGGGRIAVWRMYDLSGGAVVTDVRGGTHDTPACTGFVGTVVFGNLPIPRGSVFLIR